MDFCHSDQLAPGSYRDDGLANSCALRIHKDPDAEMAGSLRAQRDWTNHVSPVRDYHGGLGDVFSFVRVTIPECIPDRLEIISYANEFAFLYDGTFNVSFTAPHVTHSLPDVLHHTAPHPAIPALI